MSTLCLLEVNYAPKRSTADERYFEKTKQTKKLETKAMTTSSHCNTGRMFVRLPIITRENTPLAIHVVQKIKVIRAQKIGKFAV